MKLYYISQGKTIEEHLTNIEVACQKGATWVQLRLKEVEELDYLDAALKAKAICEQYDAKFLVNDHVNVAKESKAFGVHLGLGDTPIAEARRQLEPKAIIGGTANTFEDCVQHIKDGVDYVGLGPFRFTTTKSNLSPILGLEGYQKILDQLKEQGYNTPVVAIGGIKAEDIAAIEATGISGIAVSTMLTNTEESVLS